MFPQLGRDTYPLSPINPTAAVDMSYEIVGRPDAVRPIPGEAVQFTCTVRSIALLWDNDNFMSVSGIVNPLIDIRGTVTCL